MSRSNSLTGHPRCVVCHRAVELCDFTEQGDSVYIYVRCHEEIETRHVALADLLQRSANEPFGRSQPLAELRFFAKEQQ